MVVWLTFWTSGILVAVWHLGAAALAGEPGAVLFLAIWLAAAGFALRSGALHLKALLMDEKAAAPPAPRPRLARRHGRPGPLSQPASSAAATRASAAGR